MGWLDQSREKRFAAAAPLTLGSDLSGEILAVGSGVSERRVGDQVYGVTNPRFVGAYAEYALACAEMVSYGGLSRSRPTVAAIAAVAITEPLNVPA